MSLDPAYSAASPQPQTIIIQQPRESMFGRFGKLLLVALGIAVLACISMAAAYQSYFNPGDGPQEKYHSLSKEATDKIAIVTVSGTIIETDEFVMKQIDRVKEDPTVKAIVLRINSPGGTVTYSDYLYHHLRELADDPERPLPIVVSMGSLCASGGYYLAMAVGDEPGVIFAEPATTTGSIGVILPHYDVSKLLADWQVADDSIMSHPLKDIGSPTKEMTEEERKILQAFVDDMFGRFKDIVRAGRPELAKKDPELATVATGQIFGAKQALELGLIDQVGFVEDAIKKAAELAGESPDTVRCVEYKQPPSAFGEIFGTTQVKSSPLESLIELNVPRAYYMHALLPSLLSR